MIDIPYEDRKCVACGLVYVNTLLLETSSNQRLFLICPDCADKVYKFMHNMRSAGVPAKKEGVTG